MENPTFEFNWADFNTERSGRVSITMVDDGTGAFADLSDDAYDKAHEKVELKLGHTDFDLVSV